MGVAAEQEGRMFRGEACCDVAGDSQGPRSCPVWQLEGKGGKGKAKD